MKDITLNDINQDMVGYSYTLEHQIANAKSCQFGRVKVGELFYFIYKERLGIILPELYRPVILIDNLPYEEFEDVINRLFVSNPRNNSDPEPERKEWCWRCGDWYFVIKYGFPRESQNNIQATRLEMNFDKFYQKVVLFDYVTPTADLIARQNDKINLEKE